MRILIILSISIIISSCNQSPSNGGFVKSDMELAARQLEAAITHIPASENFGPVTFEKGEVKYMRNATKFTGDSSFYKIAVSHADVTMKNHYRPDYSCYHVVDYDSTGVARNHHTAQGYADKSSWSRGQAWGLYGFVMCYRKTGYKRYLEQAEKIANWWLTQKNMPEDGVPLNYADYYFLEALMRYMNF